MRQTLTPYDTGDRLEPYAWVVVRGSAATPIRWCADGADQPDPEDFGRVDFDDDESRTVLTAYIAREGSGYVLHVENLLDETLRVTGGIEAVVIGLEHSPGVDELLSLAERGREDFLHQARHGDLQPAGPGRCCPAVGIRPAGRRSNPGPSPVGTRNHQEIGRSTDPKTVYP